MTIIKSVRIGLLPALLVLVLSACSSSGSSSPQVSTTESETNSHSTNASTEAATNGSSTLTNGYVLTKVVVTDDQGFLIEQFDYVHNAASRSITGVRRDVEGDIITASFSIDLTYDLNGNPIEWNFSQARAGDAIRSRTYSYDEQNRLAAVVSIQHEPSESNRIEVFSYNAAGFLVSAEERYTETDTPRTASEYTLRTDGQPATRENDFYYSDTVSKTYLTYLYDQDNRLAGSIGDAFTRVLSYDTNGNIVTETLFNKDGSLHYTYENTFEATTALVYNKLRWDNHYYPR